LENRADNLRIIRILVKTEVEKYADSKNGSAGNRQTRVLCSILRYEGCAVCLLRFPCISGLNFDLFSRAMVSAHIVVACVDFTPDSLIRMIHFLDCQCYPSKHNYYVIVFWSSIKNIPSLHMRYSRCVVILIFLSFDNQFLP